MKNILLTLLLGSVFIYGHNGHHIPITPYISPGLQIGYNTDKTLFLSWQLTFGSGIKAGKHFEDTIPIFIGKTYGIRIYYVQKDSPKLFRYSENQISSIFGGFGRGKLIDKNGNSYNKNKFWLGGLGLITFEKIHFEDKVQKHRSLSAVFPFPIEMAFVK